MSRPKPKNVKHREVMNWRQIAFIDEYLVDLNGTKAAIRAGYKPIGAAVQASRMLRLPYIAAEIRKRKDQQMRRVEISQERTIQEIAFGCFWDPADLFHRDGSLKQIRDMDFNTRRCIAGFEVVELYEGEGEQKHAFGRLNKIKLVDRRDYLELLGRHQGLFKDELMVKHEFSAELTRIVGGGIDYSRLTDEQLAQLNARIAALVGGGADQRSLPAKTVDVAGTSHADAGRPLEREGNGAVLKVPE